MYRLAIAERIDKRVLSEAEANLMLAQLISRVNTERLERDIAAEQQRRRTAQSYEALLKGLGTWQSSPNPPVQENAVAAFKPAQAPGKTEPAFRAPITCYQNGPGITCR